MLERIIVSIPPNLRRVGYIVSVHGPLDGPLYMGSHIHQQNLFSSMLSLGCVLVYELLSHWPGSHSSEQ